MPSTTFMARLRQVFQIPVERWTLAFCLVIVLLMGIHGAVLILSQQQEMREDFERYGMSLARGLSLVGETAVLENLVAVKKALIRDAGRDPETLAVLVMDRDWRVLASDNPMRIGETLADSATQQAEAGGVEHVVEETDAQGRETLVVFTPIQADGRLQGWIRVDLSMERDLREAYDVFWKQVVVTVALLIVALSVMLTMTRRWKDALQVSEEEYRLLWETSTDAVVFMDMERRIHFANPAVKDIFGYMPEEVIGREITMLQPERLREAHRAGMERYLRTGAKTLNWRATEVAGLRKDGTEVPIEIAFSDMGMDGKRWFVGFMRDITERKRTAEALRQSEEQFRQAQKMEAIGKLAGGIAHDFNNLLTAIMGYSALLVNHFPPRDRNRTHAEEIQKAAARAASLTQQLLAFSRRQVLAQKVLNLHTVAMNLEPMLRRLIGEEIKLSIAPSQALGQVRADPGQVEQIIVNLVVNARDAMPRGGKLTIETANVELDEAYVGKRVGTALGQYVLLAVSDTGCGMDAETQAKIFEPFFTTKPTGQGTGLGLSTAYGIVKQSNGYIWVYSEPGQGATFKVYLPRINSEPDKAQTDAESDRPPRGTETILLVEDDDMVRGLVSDILEGQGYKLLVASHSDHAFRVSGRHEGLIHLLVTDVVMPGMSGRELAERLASARPGMKVLYLSGYTDDAVVRHGVLANGTAFLQKPFVPEVLLGKVREVLDAERN